MFLFFACTGPHLTSRRSISPHKKDVYGMLMSSPLLNKPRCPMPHSGHNVHKTGPTHPTRGGQFLDKGQAKSSQGHGLGRRSCKNHGPMYAWSTSVLAHIPSQKNILMVEGRCNIIMTQVNILMTQGANICMDQLVHYPHLGQYSHDLGSQ